MGIRTPDQIVYEPSRFVINRDMSVEVELVKGYMDQSGIFTSISPWQTTLPPELTGPILATATTGAPLWIEMKNAIYSTLLNNGYLSGEVV